MSKLQEQVKDGEAHVLQFMGLQRVTHDLATEQEEVKDKGPEELRQVMPTVPNPRSPWAPGL